MKNNTTILAIESSCDETSAAVVVDGNIVCSCIVSSQIPIHQRYGGVVPEIAARAHIEQITPVLEEAIQKSFPSLNYQTVLKEEIDYIAVTHGPGLIGSLLVGVNAAKTISTIYNIPIIQVNHILGHVYSNFIDNPQYPFPFITLVASGGHTELIISTSHDKHEIVSSTRDDAAGEAFDKGAQLLDLPYPGGPSISSHAKSGDSTKFTFPRGLSKSDSLDFSFSGIKTSLAQLVKELRNNKVTISQVSADISCSYQESIVDSLVTKTILAAHKFSITNVFLAGGVAANMALRTRMKEECENNHLLFHVPNLKYCTDNAAMIGAAAYGSVLLSHIDNCYDVNVSREPELSL